MKLRVALLVSTVLAGFAPSAFGAFEFRDYYINLNGNNVNAGTQYYPSGSVTDITSIPGLNTSGFNTTTGLGTLVFTYNPGVAGSYNFDAYIQEALSVPFQAEYGAVNGSPAAGQTYQIDTPYGTAGSTITNNTGFDTLDDTNHVPASAAGSLVSLAQGFDFSLAANQYEVITLSTSTTKPSGFSLEQIHPVDASNPSELDFYYSGTAQTFTNTVGGTPEPGYLALLAGAFGGLVALRRRFSKQ